MYRVRCLGSLLLAGAVLALPGRLEAASQQGRGPADARRDTVVIDGVVRDAGGSGVPGADVFLLSSLEGSVTDRAGRFRIVVVEGRQPATLVVKAPGRSQVRRRIRPPRRGIEIRLAHRPVRMEGLSVAVSPEGVSPPRTELTSLEVVRTPGSMADPFRALKSRAGVQAVDEGVGLHVQAGATSETSVLLDGTRMAAPYRSTSATGARHGSLDPFLFEEISLTPAGFDARVGDALSGVVRLESRGRPETERGRATVTLGGASARARLRLGEDAGLRASAGVTDLEPLFDVHGRGSEFMRAPRGSRASLGLGWQPGARTDVKLFALGREDRFVAREEGRDGDRFGWDSRDGHAVASVRRRSGRLSTTVRLAVSGDRRVRSYGSFRLAERDELLQARARAGWTAGERLRLEAGAVVEDRRTELRGRAAGEASAFEARIPDRRQGGFVQVEWWPADPVGFRAGLRVDRWALVESLAAGPRLGLRFDASDQLRLTAAWGRYHQGPDPRAAAPEIGARAPGLQSAGHWTAGLEWRPTGFPDRLRLQLYRKEYGGLVQEDRRHRWSAGGRGRALGIDLRATGSAPGEVRVSGSLSLVDAERTDPNTGRLAPSPFEASPSLTVQATRVWGESLEVGLAYRLAGGRPYTPVVDAGRNAETGRWVPTYGPSRSRRLPRLHRLDLSASLLKELWGRRLTTFFLTVSNVLGRSNVVDVRWDEDYSDRILVRSSHGRTVFLGVTTELPF